MNTINAYQKKAKERLSFNLYNSQADGFIYQKAIKEIKTPFISLNINTDGAPILTSYNLSIWPVMATITELGALKDSFKNIVVIDLWLSTYKPERTLYFEKISQNLKNLIDSGLLIRGNF